MVAAAFVLIMLSGVSVAQEGRSVIVGSPDQRTRTTSGPCVEVEIGRDVSSSLDCLNRQLKGQVDQVQPSLNVPPIDAKSQDLRVGIVNVPAVQQQYGNAFGRSVFPQRLPPPVYVNPVGRR
jgi:hypothetical protein